MNKYAYMKSVCEKCVKSDYVEEGVKVRGERVNEKYMCGEVHVVALSTDSGSHLRPDSLPVNPHHTLRPCSPYCCLRRERLPRSVRPHYPIGLLLLLMHVRRERVRTAQ